MRGQVLNLLILRRVERLSALRGGSTQTRAPTCRGEQGPP